MRLLSKTVFRVYLALTLFLTGQSVIASTQYKFVTVEGNKLFYREAGDPRNPVILLLHGFPSSSHMFRDLIPELERNFHIIAPDYPGMGNSDAPSGASPLTFDAVAHSMEGLMERLDVKNTIIYMQDFGGPVGMRLATWHPEWVKGLVIQNSPISLDGWNPDRLKAIESLAGPETPEKRASAEARVVLATDVFLYQKGAQHPEMLSPDAWINDAYALNDPAKRRAMTDLQLDIVSNLHLYPVWQVYLKSLQPRSLVVWGDNDPIFLPKGADAVKQFVPLAHVHHYNTGHFALEEEHQNIGKRINEFFSQPTAQ